MKKFLLFVSACLFLGASPAYAAKFVVEALLKDMAVISIQGKRYTITPARPGPEGIRLVRSNSYEAVMEVNGVRGVYTVGSQPIGTRYVAPRENILRLVPDNTGMYHVSGNINGNPVDFLVDTGATLIAMNEAEGRKLGFDLNKDGVPIRFETASGRGFGRLVKLDKVQVGQIVVHNVEAVIASGLHPRRMLLGMSFLKRIHMQRDGSLMVLTQQPQ